MAISPESSFAVKIGEEETGGTPGDLSRFSQGFQAELKPELEESDLILLPSKANRRCTGFF